MVPTTWLFWHSGLATPLGPTKMNRLRTLQRAANLNLTVSTIEPDDYLVLTPDGNHYGWVALLPYRCPVIERMGWTRRPRVKASF